MITLNKEYRLFWNLGSLEITNDYTQNCSGSITKIVNEQNIGYFESDIYQDVLDKINELNLIESEI